jgi:hypothetical protein
MEASGGLAGNIGARGCRRRRRGAYVWSVITVIVAAWMLVARVPRTQLLALAVPIALAALGFLQARARTCVFHAALGTRENDDGIVRLAPEDVGAVRRRAWRIGLESVAVGVILAIGIYVIAGLA